MRLLNGTDVNRQISVRLKILSRSCHPHSQNSARGMDNMSRMDDEEQE